MELEIKNVKDYLQLDREYDSPLFKSSEPITDADKLTIYRILEKNVKFGNNGRKPHLKVQPLKDKKSYFEIMGEPIHILQWQHENDIIF